MIRRLSSVPHVTAEEAWTVSESVVCEFLASCQCRIGGRGGEEGGVDCAGSFVSVHLYAHQNTLTDSKPRGQHKSQLQQ